MVTIEKLAQISEVSAQTIYALFQFKRGVLRVLMDEALPVDQFVAMLKAARRKNHPKKRLMIYAKISRQIYDAEKTQMTLFQSASVLAPEFKELEKEREHRRYQRQEKTIQTMARRNHLKKVLSYPKPGISYGILQLVICIACSS